MRAHGINDEATAAEPSEIAEEDDLRSRKMYALRGSASRQRFFQACDRCGKDFFSRRTFLRHGCEQLDDNDLDEEDDDDLNDDDDEGSDERRECVGWSKGRRSMRCKTALSISTQEEDLANCLVMLSSGRHESSAVALVETEESCASAVREDRTATFLPVEKPKGLFECKACKKVFTSHQALGGHRASHKKVKGCFAAKLEEQEDGQAEEELIGSVAEVLPLGHAPPLRKKKLHECTVCHRVFTSGQALGGHKRCHWLTSNGEQSRTQTQPFLPLRPISERLDLNLPATPEDGGRGRHSAAALRFNVPAFYLQAFMENDDIGAAAAATSRSTIKRISPSHVEDEAESSVKLAKLSDLKDMKVGGVSNSWLQVGIGDPSPENRKP